MTGRNTLCLGRSRFAVALTINNPIIPPDVRHGRLGDDWERMSSSQLGSVTAKQLGSVTANKWVSERRWLTPLVCQFAY